MLCFRTGFSLSMEEAIQQVVQMHEHAFERIPASNARIRGRKVRSARGSISTLDQSPASDAHAPTDR